MKRAFLIGLFTLGTVGGFAHGIASVAGHCGAGGHCRSRYGAASMNNGFEDHVAEVCARAAERVHDERAGRMGPPAPGAFVAPPSFDAHGGRGCDPPPRRRRPQALSPKP